MTTNKTERQRAGDNAAALPLIQNYHLYIEGVPVDRVRPSNLHAVAAQLLDGDAHRERSKPWVVGSPLPWAGGLRLDLRLLTNAASDTLRAAAIPSMPLRFGPFRGTLAAAPVLVAQRPWRNHELPMARRWRVRFLSPATFRHGDDCSPWPSPAAVLHGLAARWERWSGEPGAPVGHRWFESVWVREVTGQTVLVPIGGRQASCFLGEIEYQCDDEATAAQVAALLDVASLIGIGAYTTHGLGIASVFPE